MIDFCSKSVADLPGIWVIQLLFVSIIITFHVRHSQGKMCNGHGCLCVCLSVLRRIPTLLHRSGCKWVEW